MRVMAHTHGRTGATPEFDEGRQVLTLYYRALCGRACELVPYADDADLWQHPDTATTLRLPSRAPVHEGEAGSSDAWFLVAMTHRALHHVLGTFDLDLDGEEGLFTRLRPEPWGGLPALEQLVRAFGRTALATEVFAVLEDLRVDAAAQRLFAGIRPAYRQAMDEALADRPDMAELPPRSAVAEALVRLSLGAMSAEVAAELVEPLARVVSVARVLARPEATVQSSVEATIRVYDVLAGLPNLGSARSPQVVAFDELADVPDVPGAADGAVASGREELRLEGDEVFDVRFAPVRFRDVPGPRYAGQASSGMPLREAILRMSDDLSDVPCGGVGRGRGRVHRQVPAGRAGRRGRDGRRAAGAAA